MGTTAQTTTSRLMIAALQVVRDKGIAAASARTIAAAAGVNQALIFYHFGTVAELIEAASNDAVAQRVAQYRERFDTVRSLPELLAVGREVHELERRNGNVAVMAQLMAGGQHDPALARAGRHAILLWTNEIHAVLDRVLAATPAAALLDTAGLAHAISAGFIGIELYHGVHPEGGDRAFATLDQLAALVGAVNDLGPLTQTALRSAGRSVGRRATRRARPPTTQIGGGSPTGSE